MKNKKLSLTCVCVLTLWLTSCVDTPKSALNAVKQSKIEKPNLIIIFTDDQGFGDLGSFGSTHTYTPQLDKMAEEGLRLTSFYVASPLCSASRAALMTGTYPQRIGLDPASSLSISLPNLPKGFKFPVLLAGDGHGLHPNELTIAELAKSSGYSTGLFGKWHLGDQPEFLPTRQGFDEFFGLPYSHDISPKHRKQKRFNFPDLPLLDGEKVIEMNPDANYLTQRVTKRAVQFIEEHKDQPFFLYVAHPLPHGPLAASPEIKKKYAQLLASGNKASSSDYATAIYELDWSVGQILQSLKEQGIDENTIVLFTSDNGPAGRNGTGVLSGNKGQTLEGGMRMATVIRWPNQLEAGGERNQVLTAMDILPTFAKLIEAEMPTDRVIDGKNILPVLLDNQASPHEYFFYHRMGTLEAVRWRHWKFSIRDGKEALHNLTTDIGEKTNIASDQPKIVKQLKAAMDTFEQDLAINVRPVGKINNPVHLNLSNTR